MITIMGIDPSTKTGVSLIAPDGTILETAKIVTEPNTKIIKRADEVSIFVEKFMRNYAPDVLVIEDYALDAKYQLTQMVTIGTAVRLLAHRLGIPYYDVAPKTVKLWLTGHGKAQKKDMIAHVKRRFGFETKDNDIADSVAIGMYGHALFVSGNSTAEESRCSSAELYQKNTQLIALSI